MSPMLLLANRQRDLLYLSISLTSPRLLTPVLHPAFLLHLLLMLFPSVLPLMCRVLLLSKPSLRTMSLPSCTSICSCHPISPLTLPLAMITLIPGMAPDLDLPLSNQPVQPWCPLSVIVWLSVLTMKRTDTLMPTLVAMMNGFLLHLVMCVRDVPIPPSMLSVLAWRSTLVSRNLHGPDVQRLNRCLLLCFPRDTTDDSPCQEITWNKCTARSTGHKACSLEWQRPASQEPEDIADYDLALEDPGLNLGLDERSAISPVSSDLPLNVCSIPTLEGNLPFPSLTCCGIALSLIFSDMSKNPRLPVLQWWI